MFKLETYRLIRKSKKRFISLTLIVMIGVAFMMGLFSNSTLMRKSVDIYNDEYNLQDLQIYSQYGFCDEDIDELSKDENIDQLFASKQMDLNGLINDTSYTIRVTELDRNVNQYELVEGEYPIRYNECLILFNESVFESYKIGDHVYLEYDDGNIFDVLSNRDYIIRGIVKTPEYMSKSLGDSNYNNLTLNTVIFVNNSDFLSDYYTTLFITLKDSKDYLSYTNKYDDFILEKRETVDDISFVQQNYLKNKIKDEYAQDLEDAKQEFEEKKANGKEKLDDAAKQLNDANITILSYENDLNLLKMAISRLELLVKDNEEEITDSSNEIYSSIIEHGLDPSVLLDDAVQDYAKTTLEETRAQYSNLQYQLKKAREEYDKGLKEYEENLITFNSEIEKAEIEIRKAEQDLEELPNAKWMVLDRSSHYSSYMYDATCKQMEAIGFSMPFIFYLVAALVCLTTMKRLIDEQRSQIGIFIAIGYSKKQIIGKYISYSLLASLIGGIIGIIIGQLLFPSVIYHTWKLMYYLPTYQLSFPIEYVLICLLSFSLLLVLVSTNVVKQTLNEKPSSLMRPKAPKDSKEILLEKIQLIWERLSFTSKITARNIFRYKSRFFMTVFGVAGCTSLLVLGFGIKDSISDIVNIQYVDYFRYNEIVVINDNYIDEAIKTLESDLNNEFAVKYMSYQTKIYVNQDDDISTCLVIEPRDCVMAMNLYSKNSELIKMSNDGIIVTEKFAKNNSLKKGDLITIESKNGIKSEVRINDICKMYIGHYIFMSPALYETVFEENVHFDHIAVKANDIGSFTNDVDSIENIISVTDFSEVINEYNDMLSALNLIILVIIITAGSLAFVVLFNLTQVNISERIREIATLKVLGFRDLEVNSYIFKEVFLLTFIGGLLGMPLGVLEHHFIMNVINMEMVMFGMNIYPLSFMISLFITFIFTAIVLWFMRKPLRVISMVESLKSVE